MTISPTTPLILDSNQYIFGLSGAKPSCQQLINSLDNFNIFIPLMVLREVERNLRQLYRLDNAFFRIINLHSNITVVWTPPPELLVKHYQEKGFPPEDAAIAATAEEMGVLYVVSENRHFLRQAEQLPFEVVDAATALKLLTKF